MPRLLRILRRTCKITGWLACGLSALLLVGTVVLWVRSLGHEEECEFDRFEPRPHWTTPELVGKGMGRRWSAVAVHGWLWLASSTRAPVKEFKQRTDYRRIPISADQAKQDFDSLFQPGEQPWMGGTERAWRFAGAGFHHIRDALDPRIGRPNVEGFVLALPFWMLMIVLGIWPAVFILRRLLKKQPHAAGLCPHCGYDLRATPERCPECGSAVSKA